MYSGFKRFMLIAKKS